MIKQIALLLCRGTRIGYISDIHAEFTNNKKTLHIGDRNFDVLLLAGDIGNPFSHNGSYKHFLEMCTDIAKHTLVIAGNHEYYQKHRYSMIQTKMKIISICDLITTKNINKKMLKKQHTGLCGDVRFMDNGIFSYKNPDNCQTIRFICSTLWTNIDIKNEAIIYNSINDYSQIMEFTPNKSRKLYKTSCEFINHSLALSKDKNDMTNIVVTHHAPTTQEVSHPKYVDSVLNTAFSSDFIYTQGAKHPYAWIFGHTHYNVSRFDTKLNTILLSNQVGYPGEDCGNVSDWMSENDDADETNIL